MARWALVLLGSAALFTGCDDGSSDDSGAESDTTTMQSRCAMEDRAEAFHLGLARDGAATRVTFTDAEPAAPVRGVNTWHVAMSDLNDAPMEGADFKVKPWMPDHGHGSPAQVVVSEVEPGEYELTPVNLFMAGYWEITFEAGDEEVVFKLCVE